MHRIRARVRVISLIFAVAVAVNYAWELAQTPLYAGVDFPGALWHCFVASLGDGVLVLLIYTAVAVAVGSLDWYARPGARAYFAMAAAGLAVAIAVEWWGLHIAKRWQYSHLMPLLPAGIGWAPVLQMLVLPPAIFALVRRRSNTGLYDPAHESFPEAGP